MTSIESNIDPSRLAKLAAWMDRQNVGETIGREFGEANAKVLPDGGTAPDINGNCHIRRHTCLAWQKTDFGESKTKGEKMADDHHPAPVLTITRERFDDAGRRCRDVASIPLDAMTAPMTLAELGDILDCDPRTVSAAIGNGDLQAVACGARFRLPLHQVPADHLEKIAREILASIEMQTSTIRDGADAENLALA